MLGQKDIYIIDSNCQTHACTRTHTHARTHTHTHACTYIHTNSGACDHSVTHACAHACKHAHITLANTFTYVFKHTQQDFSKFGLHEWCGVDYGIYSHKILWVINWTLQFKYPDTDNGISLKNWPARAHQLTIDSRFNCRVQKHYFLTSTHI